MCKQAHNHMNLQISQLLLPWKDFVAKVRAVQAPALIIDQESAAAAGQSPPERMAADMQVDYCLMCQYIDVE